MARIGFIGLGHMGLPMAINLIKAGHEVTGYDLNPQAMDDLLAAGGRAGDSVREIAMTQSVIITMLQTGEQVKAVCLGEQGFYTLPQPNTLLHIDCSSIDVQSAHMLHEKAEQRQIAMLDAPVSGGVRGAQAGTLTLMVGGAQSTLDQAMPYLTVLGKKIIHTGAAGTGQAAKICNNMILGISMIAISEAFVLGEKLGLAAEKLFEVANNASGQCWALSQYAPVPGLIPTAPASHHYEPGFTVSMMLKDLKLSQQSADAVNFHTELGECATKIYQRFNVGSSALDFSAIITEMSDVFPLEPTI